MKLPVKITPCPIIEAVVEIRFKSNFPQEAIFGILYNDIKTNYTGLKKLPILEIPESIRLNDVNLQYAPYYKLNKDNFILQIGAKVLSIAITEKYLSWNDFKNEILEIFRIVKQLNIINTIDRIGMRYLNLFNLDIFQKIKFKMQLDEKEIINTQKNIIRLELLNDNINQIIQLSNNSDFKISNRLLHGSIIDIDTFITNIDSLDKVNESFFDVMHEYEKKLFFSYLKDDFLKNELNPEYE